MSRFRLLRGDDVPATNPLNSPVGLGCRTPAEVVAENGVNGTLVPDFLLKVKEWGPKSPCLLQAASPVVLSMIVSSIYPGHYINRVKARLAAVD
jgi:hypothetical protein